MSYDGFYLTGCRGNNAFSYEQRGEAPKLWVPPLLEGDLSDLVLGDRVVFEDLDEHGKLVSALGLKHLLRCHWQNTELVVMDNHNHAFYFWFEVWKQGRLGTGAHVLHIDQHRDTREPENWLEADATLKETFDYTNQVLNVGNYIRPAERIGLVKKLTSVTSGQELEALAEQLDVLEGPMILNLDLDFFVPELDYIDFELARRVVQNLAQRAELVTVATSPFFMDQKLAMEKLCNIFDSLGV